MHNCDIHEALTPVGPCNCMDKYFLPLTIFLTPFIPFYHGKRCWLLKSSLELLFGGRALVSRQPVSTFSVAFILSGQLHPSSDRCCYLHIWREVLIYPSYPARLHPPWLSGSSACMHLHPLNCLITRESSAMHAFFHFSLQTFCSEGTLKGSHYVPHGTSKEITPYARKCGTEYLYVHINEPTPLRPYLQSEHSIVTEVWNNRRSAKTRTYFPQPDGAACGPYV